MLKLAETKPLARIFHAFPASLLQAGGTYARYSLAVHQQQATAFPACPAWGAAKPANRYTKTMKVSEARRFA